MKNLRTIVVSLVAGALLATAGTSLAAPAINKVSVMLRPDYNVKVDGTKVDMKNAPLTYNGTTYVPLREAGEIFGYDVGFIAGTISLDSKEATAVTDSTITGTINVSEELISISEIENNAYITVEDKGYFYKVLNTETGVWVTYSKTEQAGEAIGATQFGSYRYKYTDQGPLFIKADLIQIGLLNQ